MATAPTEEDTTMVIAAMDRHEAPYIERLKEIGKAIGYGRSIQVLEQAWGDELEATGCPRRGAIGFAEVERLSSILDALCSKLSITRRDAERLVEK